MTMAIGIAIAIAMAIAMALAMAIALEDVEAPSDPPYPRPVQP